MDRKLARLLGEVLELQSEPDEDFDDLAFATEVRAALAARRELSTEAAAHIWRSPDARAIFLDLKRECVAEIAQRWTQRGFATSFERMAADSIGDDDRISAAGFSIHMLFNQAAARWLISLRLTPDALRDLPTDLGVRVSDSGGKTWLEGRLDRLGGLDGFWDDELEPRERAQRFGLSLTFF